MALIPLVHPERPKPRLKPFTALSRMQKLINNKEDTEQVFHIIEALNGDHLLKELEAFRATENGRARIEERRALAPLLDNHDWIRDLPEGTVGRAYIRFMEAEGLSAEGLVAESDKFHSKRYDDLVEWFGNRKRDTHDLFHVLSGYGRDALGEASLLAFTHGQAGGGRGVIFIAFMGCRQIRKSLPRHIDVMACYREGRENGASACKIVEQDILALMEEPLDAARARLGIAKPVAYRKALAEIRQLMDAEALMAPA
ncbi:MAG: Coq4 family protein [Pseudomonadota bacterium]